MALTDKITQAMKEILDNPREINEDEHKVFTVRNTKTGQIYFTTKYEGSAHSRKKQIQAAGGDHKHAEVFGHGAGGYGKGVQISEALKEETSEQKAKRAAIKADLDQGDGEHNAQERENNISDKVLRARKHMSESVADLDVEDGVAFSRSKNDGKYRAQSFAKGRVHKGTYGSSYDPDAEGEFKDVNPTPTSGIPVANFNTGDKVKVSAAYGKANFSKGVRHTAPHEVVSTNSTHAVLKNLVKGTQHTVPLAYVSVVGKKGRPSTKAADGKGDKSAGKWDAAKANPAAPSWLGWGKPVKESKDLEEVAKWRVEGGKNGVTGLGKTFVKTPVEYGEVIIREPIGRDGLDANSEPISKTDPLDGREKAKFSQQGKPLLPKNANRNLKGMIAKKLGTHTKANLPEEVELDEVISDAAAGRHADLEFSGHYSGSGERETTPEGHTHELVHRDRRVATGTPDSLLKTFQSGKYPGAKITRLNEDFEVEFSKDGNMYIYSLSYNGKAIAEGASVTLQGAELMADRYQNTFIAEAERFEAEMIAEESSKEESTSKALEIAKKYGSKQ